MSESIGYIDIDGVLTSVGNGAVLLDVREDDEWDAGHAASAVHIRLSELPDRFGELPRDRTILCVCRLGGRSVRAAAFLEEQGFTTLNVDGGMQAWATADLPLVSDAGPPSII